MTFAVVGAAILILVIVPTVFDVDTIRGALWRSIGAIWTESEHAVQVLESAIEFSAFVLGRFVRVLVGAPNAGTAPEEGLISKYCRSGAKGSAFIQSIPPCRL